MSVNRKSLMSSLWTMLLTALMLASFYPAFAQGTSSGSAGVNLKGRVTDSEGQPVVGAVVQNLTEKPLPPQEGTVPTPSS